MEKYIESQLNTGDIILCHGYNKPGTIDPGVDGLIEFATHSPWEHTGIIIRDPWWTKQSLKGVYIMQSGWGPNTYPDVLTGDISGVTLNEYSAFIKNRKEIYIRHISNVTWTSTTKKKFVRAFNTAHGCPYDTNPVSWAGAGIGSFCYCRCCSRAAAPEVTDTFWCSALVAFMYSRMGWINKNIDWSCQTPANIAEMETTNNCTLTVPIKIID